LIYEQIVRCGKDNDLLGCAKFVGDMAVKNSFCAGVFQGKQAEYDGNSSDIGLVNDLLI
jgi:hypothetical protein